MDQYDPKQQLLVLLDQCMKLSCRVSLCLNYSPAAAAERKLKGVSRTTTFASS